MADVVGRNETIAWCSQQLKTSPDSVSLNYAMCNLMQLTTEYNKAIAYVDKCMELVGPKSPAYRNFNDNKQAILVKAYEKTQDKQYLNSAIKLYENVIDDATLPSSGALNNLAYLLADHDMDLSKASNYARKAYELEPTNPNILDTYAFVLYKKGEFAKAAEFIHNSISMFEQSSVSAPAETYQHAGMINEKLNRKPQALAAYKQALEIGDQSLSDKNKEQIKSSIQRLSK
jgi:tetratricopeptide (TPR) repeat protein